MTDYGKVEGRVKLRSMRAEDLRLKAQQLSISTSQLQTHKKFNGRQGTQKGLLQVLWERGFIDLNIWKWYRRQVLDDSNDLVEELSMEFMMANCEYFINEQSQLEYFVGNWVKGSIDNKISCRNGRRGCGILMGA